MAMAQPQKQEPLLMTEAEYLEFEEKSEIRHEYVGGKVYAMAGAEWEHTMLPVIIKNQGKKRLCEIAGLRQPPQATE